VEHVRGNINCLALDLVCPTAVVPYAANNGTDVAAGHANGLAVVERFDSCEEFLVLLGDLGELEQVNASLLWGGVVPCGLESLPGGGYGDIDILLSGLGYRGDDLLCGRVDDLKCLLVDTLNPLVVDEAAGEC
jgi:hypothetical protein